MIFGNGVRDLAIATLICYSGLRISEIVNLKLMDIFFDSREIKVVGPGESHLGWVKEIGIQKWVKAVKRYKPLVIK